MKNPTGKFGDVSSCGTSMRQPTGLISAELPPDRTNPLLATAFRGRARSPPLAVPLPLHSRRFRRNRPTLNPTGRLFFGYKPKPAGATNRRHTVCHRADARSDASRPAL